jgi:hypothetical protein
MMEHRTHGGLWKNGGRKMGGENSSMPLVSKIEKI